MKRPHSYNINVLNIGLLLTALLLGACNKKSESSPGFIERPEDLPVVFTDQLGETWDCLITDEASTVSGRVFFEPSPDFVRSDLLHIELMEVTDTQVNPVATTCINNIPSDPVSFEVSYNADVINSSSRYQLVTTFFQHQSGDVYAARYAPDGYVEVINNGTIERADVYLSPL